MQYVGIQTQKSRNNFRSLLLLCLFPCLVMGLLFAFCYLLHLLAMNDDGMTKAELLKYSTGMFVHLAPYVLGGVHHRLFRQHKHHQLGNRFRTLVENGKQKGL